MKNSIVYILLLTILLSCGKDEKEGDPAPCSKTADRGKVKVGDFAYGGIIFYVDFTETHGLVMPTGDLLAAFDAAWWPEKAPYVTPGNFNLPTSTAIGSGSNNTAKLIGTSSTPYVVGICYALVIGECYDDWYLPSIDEAFEIYRNQSKLSGVTLPSTIFTSNLEDVQNSGILIFAKTMSLVNGTVGNTYLTNPQMQVRIDAKGRFIPIRSF
jgi:hypothetical protein